MYTLVLLVWISPENPLFIKNETTILCKYNMNILTIMSLYIKQLALQTWNSLGY